MKKWLYIAVESDIRELDAKLLLALEAAYKDYNVLLGSSKNVIKMTRFFPNGALFLKDSAVFNYDKYKKLRESGHKVIVHDEEGFVHFSDEYFINGRLKNKTLKEVDLYLCWGKYQENLVKEVSKLINPDLKIAAVGHPRIDILRKEFIAKKVVQNRILINTKVALFNYKGGREKCIEDFKRLKVIKNDDDLELIKNHAIHDEKLFHEYHKLVIALAKNYRDMEIVLRPHPSEEENAWIELFKDYPNVIVTKVDSVHKWIEKSDVVIHTNCTTGIEAVLMDAVVIAFAPLEDDEFTVKLPNQVSLETKNFDELTSVIDKVNKTEVNERKELMSNKKDILRERLSNIDEIFSSEEIMKEVDKFDLKPLNTDFVGQSKLNIRNIFNSFKKEKIDKKFSNIDVEVMKTKALKFKSRFGNLEDVNITQVYNNVFLINQD